MIAAVQRVGLELTPLTMLIWLGKQYLGQSDKNELTNHGPASSRPGTCPAYQRGGTERFLIQESLPRPA